MSHRTSVCKNESYRNQKVFWLSSVATEVSLSSFQAPKQKQNELKTWPEANSLSRETGALQKRWLCETPTASSVPQIQNWVVHRPDASFHARLASCQVSSTTAASALEIIWLLLSLCCQSAAKHSYRKTGELWRGSSWNSLIMKYFPFKPSQIRSRNHLPAEGKLSAAQHRAAALKAQRNCIEGCRKGEAEPFVWRQNRRQRLQKSVLSQFPQPLFHEWLASQVKFSPALWLHINTEASAGKVAYHSSKNAVWTVMWFKEAIQSPATQVFHFYWVSKVSTGSEFKVVCKKPSFLIAKAGLPQESHEFIEGITLTRYKQHHSQ